MTFIKRHINIAVVIAYTLLTLAMTFPLVLRFGSEIPKGGGDTYQSIAHIDTLSGQLKSLDFFHGAVFLIKNIGTYSPYVFLNLFLNKFAAYNAMFLLSFVLSGFGTYLLALYFTKNKPASFLAGLIFAFSPFHFYQSVAVHLGTMQQEWLPFFALYLFKFFEKFRLKYYVLTIVFAFLIAMSEHQLLAFTVLFAGFFVVYRLIADRKLIRNKRLWAYGAVSAAFLGIAAVTLFSGLLKVATSDNNFLGVTTSQAAKYSMMTFDPIAPPAFNTLWPQFGEAMQKLILGDTERGSYFVGFSVLAVILFAIYSAKKEGKGEFFKNARFWLIETAVFYVLALGPTVSIAKQTVYLPYFMVYKFLPFYDNIRTTGRIFIFAMLGVSILFAYSFAWLLKKYKGKELASASALAVLILLEFFTFPLQTFSLSYSPFYDMLGKDTAGYKILEIPGSTSYEFVSYESMTANVHHKELVGGMPMARKIAGEFAWENDTPVVKQLLYTIPKGHDPAKKVDDPNIFWQANKILNGADIRYVTIAKDYVKPDILTAEENFIEKYIKYDSKYEDKFIVAYKVSDLSHTTAQN